MRRSGARRRAGRAAAVLALFSGQLQDTSSDRAQRDMVPRSSGSRRLSGRVVARCFSSRADVSGRNSLPSGSGVVTRRSRSCPSAAHLALTAPSRAATKACKAWRSPPARGLAGRSKLSTPRAARTASSASVLPPERRSRRSLPTSSTRSPRPLSKRVRPAPNEPAPSIANDAPTRRVRLDELQRVRVAVACRGIVVSKTTAPLSTSTTASACQSRCGSTPTT